MSADDSITLRAARPTDHDFLVALYASTRADEFAAMGWPVETEQAFMRMQFEAQRRDYEHQHPGARCEIVEQGLRAIGRLWVAQDAHGLTVLDISFVAERRGQGVGTACLRRVLRRADVAGLDVHLQVLVDSPARRLYERLGFQPAGPGVVRQAVVRRPAPAALTPPQENPHEQA
jgi:RimJ/RimL family protein N-acetyltransferase